MKVSSYSPSVINQIANVKSQEISKLNIATQEALDTSHPMDTKNLAIKHSISDFIQYIPNPLTTIENKKTDIVAMFNKILNNQGRSIQTHRYSQHH